MLSLFWLAQCHSRLVISYTVACAFEPRHGLQSENINSATKQDFRNSGVLSEAKCHWCFLSRRMTCRRKKYYVFYGGLSQELRGTQSNVIMSYTHRNKLVCLFYHLISPKYLHKNTSNSVFYRFKTTFTFLWTCLCVKERWLQ